MKKSLLWLLLILLSVSMIATFSLAGCKKEAVAPAEEEVVEEAAPVEEEQEVEEITLKYWTLPREPSLEGESKALELFMEENPNIKVEFAYIDLSDYDTKVATAAEGGSPPDVARVNHVTLVTWAKAGYLASIDDYIAKSDVIDVNDFFAGVWAITKFQGKQYSLPIGTDTRVLWCNTKMFKEAGLDGPPKTWEEFKDMAQVLTHDDQYGFGAGILDHIYTTSYENFGAFLVTNGGNILKEEDSSVKAISSQDPATVEAYEFFFSLLDDGLMPKETLEMDSTGIETLFLNNKLAMFYGGPWVKGRLETLNPDIKFDEDYFLAAPPINKEGQTPGAAAGGWQLGVFEGSQHKDAAFKLVEFMMRPDMMALFASKENFPVRGEATGYDPWVSDPFYKAFFDTLPGSSPPFIPITAELNELVTAWHKYAQLRMLKDMTTEEALTAFDNDANENIIR